MLTLPWSCSFHSNDITQSASDPFFRVSVLLSLEFDSKFVGPALSSPYTVAILQGIRENIFMSISLLNKVFSSNHPKPWYRRFCQIRKRKVWWSLTFRLNFRFQEKKGEGRRWGGAQYYIVSPISLVKSCLYCIADTSHPYVIPNCSIKLQCQ